MLPVQKYLFQKKLIITVYVTQISLDVVFLSQKALFQLRVTEVVQIYYSSSILNHISSTVVVIEATGNNSSANDISPPFSPLVAIQAQLRVATIEPML